MELTVINQQIPAEAPVCWLIHRNVELRKAPVTPSSWIVGAIISAIIGGYVVGPDRSPHKLSGVDT
jgi:hypothetical protein